jgi:putative methionine-R-sulfoxide reductase with GAF domain
VEGPEEVALSRQGDPDELSDSLTALARVLISQESVESTTQRIAELAVKLVNGGDYAGISLVRRGQITTLGATDQVVEDLDAIQYDFGQGPCLSSIQEQETFQIDDMCSDSNWPEFSARACEVGIGGLLAFVLKVSDDSLGALNLYSRWADAFSPEDRVTGALFATYAAIALANAQTHARDIERVAELERGLVTRDAIGAAIGIIMQREGLTSAEAFDYLRTQSQQRNEKLRVVAEEIVLATERALNGSGAHGDAN